MYEKNVPLENEKNVLFLILGDAAVFSKITLVTLKGYLQLYFTKWYNNN